jgi:hypothetical protein
MTRCCPLAGEACGHTCGDTCATHCLCERQHGAFRGWAHNLHDGAVVPRECGHCRVTAVCDSRAAQHGCVRATHRRSLLHAPADFDQPHAQRH